MALCWILESLKSSSNRFGRWPWLVSTVKVAVVVNRAGTYDLVEAGRPRVRSGSLTRYDHSVLRKQTQNLRKKELPELGHSHGGRRRDARRGRRRIARQHWASTNRERAGKKPTSVMRRLGVVRRRMPGGRSPVALVVTAVAAEEGHKLADGGAEE